ncbi:MAG: ABC transporter permease [Chloroflexi bacterium]|nr:ABC transporter permease [Ardenticatenaceae bacterium]MBL1130939.1 ABC transporter permease [Chloroflexota bacterium]NOG37035.1 ABC transporter permease [Chloroflexota bacterium]
MDSNRLYSTEVFDTDVLRSPWAQLRETFRYTYLLRNLVQRDVKVRYKNSLLGVVWSLLNPLLMMMVYTVLFTILRPNNSIQYFHIFILVALIPWQFLAGTVLGGTVSITQNASLVKKVFFPRALLPTSVMFSQLINFILSFVVLVLLLYLSGIGLTRYVLWVPVILFTQMVFMLGLALALAAAQTFYRDTLQIVQVAILAWFFLTPIFYPFEDFSQTAEMLGWSFNPARLMRWINPMASIVDSYRTVLWGTMESQGQPVSMDPLMLGRTFVTAVITLVIGYYLFIKTEHLFGEKL